MVVRLWRTRKELLMEAIEIPDWEMFEQKVRELRTKYTKESSPLLFRGQGNSKWSLTTTLERSGAQHMLFREYYTLVCASIAPEVRTFARVDVPTFDPLWCAKYFLKANLLYEIGDVFPIATYRYMAYLRHFGFPSPLLDWSRSPFVAAFFAFRDDPGGQKAEKRSIFAYCERPVATKGGTLGQPHIRTMGPYVETHERHFRQRCDYTICGTFNEDYGWRFDSHQAVFDQQHPAQDRLWRFDLPSSERRKVLGALGDYNLNAFSLFGSEESLLETMWLREYVLRKRLS
jgi:hypothetical protein